MALTGENFCAATTSAFYTVKKNAGRFSAVEGLGHLLINFGSLSVASLSTYCGYLYITKSKQYKSLLAEDLFPTIVKLYLNFI